MTKQTTRRVKLHSKYRPLQTGCRSGKDVPWLNISGVWLERAGFRAGDQVEIFIENNILTIKHCCADGNSRH